ncbi:MAG: peptidyl-prolyl cis-trans isomerase [Candidatus Cloacimonetes bacterium]|nr:peptidyl-prolyl cis-trans isomerase [Candidatus Cloacimonadota bacterium]
MPDLNPGETLNVSAVEAWARVLENLSFASLKAVTSEEVSAILTSFTTLTARTFSGFVMSLDISEAKNSAGNHLVRLGFQSESEDPVIMGQVESFVRRYANWVLELPAWSASGLIKSRSDFISHPEIGARHILLSLENRTKEEALSLGQSLIERLKAGESFAELAKEYSADASNRDNGGDLGTFGKGRMVKPFEEAAYALKVGEVTQTPVETEFGFHIIERTQ